MKKGLPTHLIVVAFVVSLTLLFSSWVFLSPSANLTGAVVSDPMTESVTLMPDTFLYLPIDSGFRHFNVKSSGNMNVFVANLDSFSDRREYLSSCSAKNVPVFSVDCQVPSGMSLIVENVGKYPAIVDVSIN